MIKAKRSLGQNFFVNSNLAKQIVDIVSEKAADILVEIGPGEGAFSNLLNRKSSNFLMIEKDNLLASALQNRFPERSVINTDFLTWDFEELKQYSDKRIVFFGALPYNISKKIIEKIIKSEYFNSESYFIIQKEVAERYTDREPNNNILSIQTQIYANCKKLFDIKPEAFRPKPKVTSTFIQFKPQKDKNISKIKHNKNFRIFLQSAFTQQRKMLSNNLKRYTFKEDGRVKELLSARPQHLSVEDYIYLFTNIA